jgi:hypothetical protein
MLLRILEASLPQTLPNQFHRRNLYQPLNLAVGIKIKQDD